MNLISVRLVRLCVKLRNVAPDTTLHGVVEVEPVPQRSARLIAYRIRKAYCHEQSLPG